MQQCALNAHSHKVALSIARAPSAISDLVAAQPYVNIDALRLLRRDRISPLQPVLIIM